MIKAGVILISSNFEQVLIVSGKKYRNPFTGYMFKNGIYSFPKGHIEPGEELHACAERELNEETNIKIKISKTDMSIHLADGVYFIKFVDKKEIKFRNNRRWEVSNIFWKNISFLRDIACSCNRALREFIKNLKQIKKMIIEKV